MRVIVFLSGLDGGLRRKFYNNASEGPYLRSQIRILSSNRARVCV
jgi:hypothetical protein